MEPNLLDKMLQIYLEDQKTVAVTLQNKVRVTGKVAAFDNYVLVLDGQKREIIYRHAVSALSLAGAPESRQPVTALKPAPSAPRHKSTHIEKPRPASAHPSSPAKENGINTGMKEGLLKWMAGQKAK
ncbi:MAG TPA: RNA chaperone Hfq [Nitrospirota bacterium]|nr:RNA chaperone Hfq [Nitrospirota bacterium]